MIPKEKAKQLFNKFTKPIDELHKYPMCFDTAKQCALIAVDELIDEQTSWQNGQVNPVLYWQEVKQEIEKL